MSWRRRVSDWLPKPLSHVVVRHADDGRAAVRRRRVVAVTSVLGAGLLGAGLSTRPGSRAFYGYTFAVAATWTAGGLLSGPLHLGWVESRDDRRRRPGVVPAATGAAAFAVFYAGGRVAKHIGFLDRAVSRVLSFAEAGDDRLVMLTTLANGLSEEVFFRGALYSALPERHAVAGSTAVYTLATTTTRNPSLVLAAGVMGTLWGLQRRASGGLQAPVITHLTWSVLMLRYLPPLFRDRPTGTGPGGRPVAEKPRRRLHGG